MRTILPALTPFIRPRHLLALGALLAPLALAAPPALADRSDCFDRGSSRSHASSSFYRSSNRSQGRNFSRGHVSAPSGYYKKVYRPAVYRTVYDHYGHPRRVCVQAARYERVWVSTRSRSRSHW